jgi:hypothetical protein
MGLVIDSRAGIVLGFIRVSMVKQGETNDPDIITVRKLCPNRRG